MSKQFFARVHFPGVDEGDEAYETLADEMAKQAFRTALVLPNREARLPPGTFVAAGDAVGSAEEALRRVQLAAKSTGLAAAIVVFDTDRPVQTYGLDTARPPAVTGG